MTWLGRGPLPNVLPKLLTGRALSLPQLADGVLRSGKCTIPRNSVLIGCIRKDHSPRRDEMRFSGRISVKYVKSVGGLDDSRNSAYADGCKSVEHFRVRLKVPCGERTDGSAVVVGRDVLGISRREACKLVRFSSSLSGNLRSQLRCIAGASSWGFGQGAPRWVEWHRRVRVGAVNILITQACCAFANATLASLLR
jgi:hypothetical protein